MKCLKALTEEPWPIMFKIIFILTNIKYRHLINNNFKLIKELSITNIMNHNLSMKGAWELFGQWTPKPSKVQKLPFRTPRILCEEFLEMSISSI